LIIEIDHLADATSLAADLCIVGAGAAGLVIAREFLGTGTQVVLLESGGWTMRDDVQDLYGGEIEQQPFRGLQAGRARVFGGTTTLWGGQCIPLDPIDFEARPWVRFSGWPITSADLASYYDRAKQRLEIAPEAFDKPAWQRFGLDPLDLDADRLAATHGVFIRQPDLGQRFRAELAAAANIRVLLHANTTRLDTDASGTQIQEVTFRSLGGRKGGIKARRVALCAGGIENARLLLLSDQAASEDAGPGKSQARGPHAGGLGNSHDLVGRFLQDHPCGRTAEIVTTSPRPLQDHWNMLYSHRAHYLPKLALSEAAQRREQVLSCVGRLEYEYEPDSGMQAVRELFTDLRARRRPPELVRKLAALGRGSPDLALVTWRRLARGLSPATRPRRIYLEAFTEQAPMPDSRITLADSRDALGLRRVKVDWRLDASVWKTLRVFTRCVQEEFARLGLGEVRPADWLAQEEPPGSVLVDSYHPAGTTRMARRPEEGVVDADCQVFGVHGLYVAGSSVFPTSGAANPTLTLIALALRLAERLKNELAQQAAARPNATASLARVGGA
jgi:choline dehydrogenase-like flavoprotein